MRKDDEYYLLADQLKKRLQQKRRTSMSVGSYILHYLRQYARFPDEMRVKYANGIVHVRLIQGEDKTHWFHMREQYRKQLNENLEQMGYQVIIRKILIK